MLNDRCILVISDQPNQLHDISLLLQFISEKTISCSTKQWLEKEIGHDDLVGLIFLCPNEQAENASYWISELKERYPKVPVVLIGDFIIDDLESKPELKSHLITRLSAQPNYNEVNDAIHRAQRFNEFRLQHENEKRKRPTHLFRSLVGTSREIQTVRTMMSQVADNDATVLIAGESGTGKEVVARNLHYNSSRRSQAFVPVNCGAIPAELLESELFGHEKGAFTGAISARAGRFELAEGGTLFLDEIGDMPLHMQVKILRVLQEKTFERVGGNKSFTTNVRIIAATHRNLEQMITDGKFREDLYYRLNVFPIEMPGLRERSEDIPLLINELVIRLEKEKRGSIRFNSAAILSLCQHSWSGNVRELANLVERMAIMKPFGVVGVQDLPTKYRYVDVEDDFPEIEDDGTKPCVVSSGDIALLPESGIDLKKYIMGLEQSLIQQALNNTGGVVARAAEQLAIRRTTLVEKMRKYGLNRN